MSLLTLPRKGIALSDADGTISAEWYRWAHDVTGRAGGVSGVGTTDLLLSQFEDAGVEETKLALEILARSMEQAPREEAARVDQLEALLTEAMSQIQELRREVAGIQQGYLA